MTDSLLQERFADFQATEVHASETAPLLFSLLLVAPAPVTVEELALGAELPIDAIHDGLAELERTTRSGWVIQRHNGRLRLASEPRFAAQVRRFLGIDRQTRLSPAALETLAIIAYQQPVTRAEIDAVRGVDSSGVLMTLLQRGLVEGTGRLTTPGNPIQYGTTDGFLLHFGLTSLDNLPPIGQVGDADGAERMATLIASAAEEPKVAPVYEGDSASA